jgi:hypothetical protein
MTAPGPLELVGDDDAPTCVDGVCAVPAPRSAHEDDPVPAPRTAADRS